MSISLRWRLAAAIVLAFILTLVVVFVTVQFALQRILINDLDDGLAQDADRVQAQLTLVGSLDNTGALSYYVQQNANAAEGRTPFITVISDASGRPLAAPQNVQEQRLTLSPNQLQDVLAGQALKRTVDLPGEQEYRVRAERLVLGGQTVGVVQVARVTKGVVDPVNTLLVILLAEGIVAVIITVALAIWLSRGAVRPLQRVIDVAAEIQASDLTRRINARRQPPEVQKLADTFDAMLERLDKAFREQQHFVMDVSHELRTPLTVLKGNLDVMLMDPHLSPEQREQYERMSSEVSRLIRLTSNLLYIAAAEAGRQPERRPVELDVICLEVVRQSRDLRPDVKLTLAHEDQLTVMGDRDQLKQMVLNLVENAMKYTPAGGNVTLGLYRNRSEAHVRVKDTGPGIPADMLPHIFERFYRGSQRSMMGGTGLGLAIADRIARAHSGSIAVESEVGRGSTFTVRLPMAGDGDDGAPTAPQG